MSDDLNAVGGHCPRCGTEYRPGFTECADCHVPVVPGPAPEIGAVKPARPEDAPEPDRAPLGDPAVVGSWPWQEAWLLAGRLRADGIDARVEPDDYSGAYGTVLHGSFDVVVPRDMFSEARRLLGLPATS